ncbi:MAG TPA: peroxidase family protein [Chthoniobacterales bacterium]|nr:peroxidase family protein [Chthoniobacterales bacterium]
MQGPALSDTTGESQALMGLAYFQRQEHEQAAHYYEAALKLAPNQTDWRDMLGKAQANAIAEVNVHVPEIYYFDRSKLLEPANPAMDPSLTVPKPRQQIWGERARRKIGGVLGKVATATMNGATHLWGSVAGYRDRVWTNWYRRSLTLGILTLAYMREQLNKGNLKNTYPGGTLIGFQKPGQQPPPSATSYRTADGTWNNLDNPKEGAAGTRFLRNVHVDAIRPETGRTLLTPNPREISRKLLTRGEKIKEVPFLNMLAGSWIQFQNGDWINHGEILYRDVHEVPLAEDDPARRNYRQSHIFVGKTQPDPTFTAGQEETPITFINEVTHWWDGSQIYGSDQETQNRLRSNVDGKMKLNEDGTLPLGTNGVEDTGFRRNWWVGMTILHTLFVHEHNAICDRLKVSYPQWNDNRLFNVARLINAAVMAKIHTVEWTPAILPNPGLNAALNANWYGILTNLLERGKDRKTLADVKVSNPELGGVVGNPIDKHGQPYGLTEEFTEVYRLHSLLPESLQIRTLGNGAEAIAEIPFVASRQAGSKKLTGKFGLANILYSFGTQHPGALVLNNYPRFMQELSIPGNPLFDMGAVDILRARERGVPRYNEFRRQLGMNPIQSFDDLTDDKEQVEKIKEVYGDKPEDVEKLDLLIGTLSEGTQQRPTKFGFGETMFQIFILNATRRLQADRFYTDSYNEDTYTREGLDWIDSSNLKTVLLRNFPELGQTGLANVANAFEPWDTGERLDPDRHPLREYDVELKSDPWLGDSYR